MVAADQPMRFETHLAGNDDPEFVSLAGKVLSSLVDSASPNDVFVVRIDNWFDHKWLKFSGKGRVPFDFSIDLDHPQVALDEFHQEKVTFPPFSPRRVVSQQYFKRPGTKESEFPHPCKKEKTAKNLQRRVTQISQSGVFVWFSSHSRPNGRGSMMAYVVDGDRVTTWYASFVKAGVWKIDRVKGIERETLDAMLGSPVIDFGDEYEAACRVMSVGHEKAI